MRKAACGREIKYCGLKAGVFVYRCVNILHAGFPPEADLRHRNGGQPAFGGQPRHKWRGIIRHNKIKVCNVRKVRNVYNVKKKDTWFKPVSFFVCLEFSVRR